MTLSNRVVNSLSLDIHDEEPKVKTDRNCSSDSSRSVFRWPTTKTTRALSVNEEKIQASSNNNDSRLKDYYTRFKRRFSMTKECRTGSDDVHRGLSIRFSNYKSFSSTVDDSSNDFEWPDFEKIYDTIPPCLAKILPGLDDLSLRENDDDDDDEDTTDSLNLTTNETDEILNLFKYCKRGKHFRRNAICNKLDKSQYNGQLDTFIQQLMIEKLMRTWT